MFGDHIYDCITASYETTIGILSLSAPHCCPNLCEEFPQALFLSEYFVFGFE